MFKFYHCKTDHFTYWVEEKLKEMVVDHKLIKASGNNTLPDGITEEMLPVLSDGHETWTSQKEIKEFLVALEQDLNFSRSLTSDACYVDPDNPDKCL